MNFKYNYICPYCNEQISVDLSSSIELITTEDENMEDKNHYRVNYSGICPECKNTISVNGEIVEYPIGTDWINNTDIIKN